MRDKERNCSKHRGEFLVSVRCTPLPAVLASDRQLLVWRQVTNAEKADKECDLQMAQLCSELHENEDAEANAVPFTHIQNSCCLFSTLLATLSLHSSGFPALPNVASSSTLVLDFVCYDSFMQSTIYWFSLNC